MGTACRFFRKPAGLKKNYNIIAVIISATKSDFCI
jgi:hypothetical protein